MQDGMAAGSRCSNPNKWAQHPHVPSSYAQDSKKRTPSVCFSLCLGCFCWFFVLWGMEGGQNSFFSLISSRNPDFLVLFVSAALPRFSSQVDVSQLSAA